MAEDTQQQQDTSGDDLAVLRSELEQAKAKISEFRETNIQQRQKLEELGAIDPDEYNSLKEEAKARERERAKKEGEFERLLTETQEEYEARLKQKDEALARTRQQLEQRLKEDALEREMFAQGMIPELRDVAMSYANSFFQTVDQDDGSVGVVVVDKDGKRRYNTDGDPMTVTEWVEEFGTTKAGERFFGSDVKAGSGATGKQGAGGTRSESAMTTRQEKVAAIRAARDAGMEKPWEVAVP